MLPEKEKGSLPSKRHADLETRGVTASGGQSSSWSKRGAKGSKTLERRTPLETRQLTAPGGRSQSWSEGDKMHTSPGTHESSTPSDRQSAWEVLGKTAEAKWISKELQGLETEKLTARQRKRNEDRVRALVEADSKTVGKCLPPVEIVFDDSLVLRGPNDFTARPKWMVDAVEAAIHSVGEVPKKPPFRFEQNWEAAEVNWSILEESSRDLHTAILKYRNTTIGYGSEFRKVETLKAIYGRHPNFAYMEEYLTNGVIFKYTRELSEDERKREVQAVLNYGNHKSASESRERIRQLLRKDVEHGFALPLPTEKVTSLEGLLVQPIGMVEQMSINEEGGRTPKRRLTHDSSFCPNDERNSVNERVDLERYAELIYGNCMSRILHWIVALRLAYPDKTIFIAKFDFADAYRRLHHQGSSAAQQVMVFEGIAYVMLRLAFGGSSNPASWCAISESMTDLANELSDNEHWNPKILKPLCREDVPMPKRNSGSKLIRAAKEMAVEIPTDFPSRSDDFIDDIINVCVDDPEVLERSGMAGPLVVDATMRPHAGDREPVKRRSNLGGEKLASEGTHAEVQQVLGWETDAKALEIRLPHDKLTAWTRETRQIVKHKRTTFGELETTVGRLNHVAMIMPLTRHFLTRLRNRLRIRARKKTIVTLNSDEVEDLVMFIGFMDEAAKGVSMNLIVLRRPEWVAISDACPIGVGGFLWNDGFAWRIRIPESSPIRESDSANNVLEFLGMAVNIWLMCDRAKEDDHRCLLALGDNTSAIGWIFRSGKVVRGSIYFQAVQLIARKVATLVYKKRCCLYSQHIKGDRNEVADLLSFSGAMRDKSHPIAWDDPSNDELTERFLKYCPQILPDGFKICQLDEEKNSWIVHVLRTLELSLTRGTNKATNRTIETGGDGVNSRGTSGSTNTRSINYHQKNRRSSRNGSSIRSVAGGSTQKQERWLASVTGKYWEQLSRVPQDRWLRRCGAIAGTAPFTTKGGGSEAL